MTATAWPPRQHDDTIPGDPAPWMAGAPCRRSPELFFSDEAGEIAEAKRICRTQCASDRFNACRSYAKAERIPFGVWGGQTELERNTAMFSCSSCGELRNSNQRRGEWCAACVKRQRRAGADTPPPPKSPADRRTSVTQVKAQQRFARYAEMREIGIPKKKAASDLGLADSTMHEYERNWQASAEVAA